MAVEGVPPWIKVFTRLHHNDAWMALSGNRREILSGDGPLREFQSTCGEGRVQFAGVPTGRPPLAEESVRGRHRGGARIG